MNTIKCQFCGDESPEFDYSHVCSSGKYKPNIAPKTKPLSDEEIEQVIKTFQLNSLMKNLNYKDFARAVEERIRNGK